MQHSIVEDIDSFDDSDVKYENETIFHTNEWLQVLKSKLGQEPIILLAKDKEKIYGKLILYKNNIGVLNRLYSPSIGTYTPYGGPIVAESEIKDRNKIH